MTIMKNMELQNTVKWHLAFTFWSTRCDITKIIVLNLQYFVARGMSLGTVPEQSTRNQNGCDFSLWQLQKREHSAKEKQKDGESNIPEVIAVR